MANTLDSSDELVTTIKNAAGITRAITENLNWIEVFFECDIIHTQTVDPPDGIMSNIKVKLAQDLI